MRINEIITENIFTCDYHQVMQAVAELYQNHYGVNIWEDADTHDAAARALMKARPSQEQLEWIIDSGELPDALYDVDFPVSEKLMLGLGDQPLQDDLDVDEGKASRELCTSGKPDSALGASNLASCKSQGYRSREGGKSHKVGSERVKVRGKKIKGKKYGGPLPDWS